MSDAQRKHPQDAPDNNPFRDLDKKHFPEKRSTAKKNTPIKRPQSVEQDDHLFLQAMEGALSPNAAKAAANDEASAWAANVLPLADRHKNHKHVRKAEPNPPQAAPAAPPATSLVPASPPPVPDTNDFTAAMRDVKPLTHKGRDVPAEPAPKTAPPAGPVGDNTLRDFVEGRFEFALHHTDEYVEGHVVGLDPLAVGKLQAGQCSPEGNLDLHGLNAVQSYAHLISFMRNAYLRSWRTVLIVPGRGLNSPNGMPVLREKVQIWLTQEPLRRVVLAFCTAQLADGGAGALYVLLRKFRKGQGKVQWDRTPTDPDLLL